MLASQKTKITELFKNALAAVGAPENTKIVLERPKQQSHGDIACTVALQCAKAMKQPPRVIAEKLVEQLRKETADSEMFSAIEIAGPGFINLKLAPSLKQDVVREILKEGPAYGCSDAHTGESILLEYVSANPTGPLHLGHARQGALGDVLSRLLKSQGWAVTREFYYNDAGNQIHNLAISVQARCYELQNKPFEFPEDGYKGAYIDEIARRVIDEAKADGIAILDLPRVDGGVDNDGNPLGEGDSEQREEFRKRAVPMMFDEIRKSMKDFRVNFDVWFHENSLYSDGEVDKAIADLRERGDIYEKDGATWFESTKHGDDKDRVIIKSDGNYAYFAADIAYYRNKRHRDNDPADIAIYMLGADHHGYIGRMMAMCAAFGDEPGENMQILIGQLVNVLKDGKAVRMSKRAGNVVTIDDLTDAIGVDASRYSLARTDYNSPVDIDLNLLASHSNENPVYYVQYAHARSCNVDRNAAAAGITYEGADVSLLDTAADGEVLAALAQWPALLREAGDLRAPHRVAHYLEDLAATYHKWYNVERVVPMELTDPEARGEQAEALRIAKAPEPARAAARLKLNDAVKTVIAEGLDLLGVAAPDRM